MASKRVLLVGLGNYTHPQTRHSIGLLLLDYIASQLNLTWSKNKSIHAYITRPTTIYVDPSQSSIPSKQTRESKKEKKAKKKEWDFGSESDKDTERNIINGDTTTKDENDPIKSTDSSSTDGSTPKPKKIKPKPDPVPLELTLLKPLLLMNVSGKSISKAVRELGFSHTNIIVIHDDMQREFGKISIKNGGSANGHNGIKSVIDHLKTDEFQRLRIGIGRPPGEIDVTDFVLSHVPLNEMEIYNNDVFPRCKDELFKASIRLNNNT